MEQAAQLLNEGELSIGDIARAVGYHGDGHFQQAFKQAFGVTPREMRHALRGGKNGGSTA